MQLALLEQQCRFLDESCNALDPWKSQTKLNPSHIIAFLFFVKHPIFFLPR